MTVLSRSKNAAVVPIASTLPGAKFGSTLVGCHRVCVGSGRALLLGPATDLWLGGPLLPLPSCSFLRAREGAMLISCWSSKGGAGTTVVAAALAITLAHAPGGRAVLADLAGDALAVLGLHDEPSRPGLAAWLGAGDEVPADGLARLEVPVRPGLTVLPRGRGPLDPLRAEVLAGLLAADHRPGVVDAGVVPVREGDGRGAGADGETALVLAAAATHSLLVLRPCYLALRRARSCPLRPSGVVLVREDGRALDEHDVEDALVVPVPPTVRVPPKIARAVDAGMLAAHLPRSLAHDLRSAA